MILPRMWRRALALVIFVVLGGSVGVQAVVSAQETEAPIRPDFTEMTPEQAAAALEKHRQAMREWERQEEPRREQAIKEAVARQEERKKAKEQKESNPTLDDPVESPKVEVAPDYDWERDAQAQGLDEGTRAQLRRDALVIAGREFPQAFSVYGSETIIPFVTSDSLLNGFHVLLEASLKKFELRRATQLREMLETAWLSIDRRLEDEKVPRALVEPYLQHLARVVGPALRLLGSSVPLGGPTVEADVEAAVGKITAAHAVELPEWMGPAEPALLAIDFRRCRPLGFYSESPVLSDYYRAVRWLQLVPLRAARENEAGAAALMADLARSRPRGLGDFVEQGESIWGRAEEASVSKLSSGWIEFLRMIANEGNTAKAVEHAQSRIASLSQRYRTPVNDRLRAPGAPENEAALLVLAPSVLPDALFLEALTEKRRWPQGLEVAAWLGSDLALRTLAKNAGPDLAEAVKAQRRDSAERWRHWDNVPELYYDVLRALLEPPDPAAPAFMDSEAWQRKSVQTALAGWAQLRHAWELQTKLNVSSAGMSYRPSGFIEPNPEFFRRLSQLKTALVARFQAAGVFAETPVDEIEFLRGELRVLERLGLGKVDMDVEGIDSIEMEQAIELAVVAGQSDETIEFAGLRQAGGEMQKRFWTQVKKAIHGRIDRLERGERVPPIASRIYRSDADQHLFGRWQSLQSLTARLEAMVQKQLRGADWNENEASLLKNYGTELGEIMGYLSSASDMPVDDAPRWTTVYYDPAIDRNLAVAIGRPRALYVLYPWRGKSILCRGAVMSYFEYPSENRLTDTEWKELLDSPKAPAQPEWLQPLLPAAPKKQ